MAAALCALVGKILGIKGLFFRVAGHEVAQIDDSGGTMPPFERHIILGPKDPHRVAKRVWKQTGLWALILMSMTKGQWTPGEQFPSNRIKLGSSRKSSVKPAWQRRSEDPLIVIKFLAGELRKQLSNQRPGSSPATAHSAFALHRHLVFCACRQSGMALSWRASQRSCPPQAPCVPFQTLQVRTSRMSSSVEVPCLDST